MLSKRYRTIGASSLIRYLVGACAVRIASEGVAIALVLVTRASGAGSAIEGLFLAAWSGPSLLSGVVVGQWLDRADRPGLFLASSGLLAAAALGLDAALLGHAPTGVLIAGTAIGGATVPLFTGGLSSLLPALVETDALGSAQALDSATYSVAGIAGPALVALLAAVWSPRAALAVPALAVASGSAVLPLNGRRARPDHAARRSSLTATVAALGSTRQLMAATTASTLAAFGWGGLEIGAVAIAALVSSPHLAGVYLATLAATALLAALYLARRPLRHPDRAIPLSLLTMTGGGLLIALPRSSLLAASGFALFGIGDGVLLPAVLSVRSRDAPPRMTAAVFTTAASLKTAASAIGAAIAGLALTLLGSRGLFAALAATQLLAASTTIRALTSADPVTPSTRVEPSDGT
jgi:MFS family permease